MSNWYTVKELVHSEVLATPMDGNHGEIHPVAKDFMQAGVPFIMSSDINNGVVDYINCKFISKEHSLKLRKGFSKFGDVLLTHKASIGRTAINSYTDDEFIMLTPQVTYYRVINDQVLNSAFLKYYFNSSFFQTTIKAWSDAGSTRAYIGITKQLDLPIFVPAIQQQRQIAAVLSALDDKIELNNQINAELEAMAKTLYDYWFVQFDFPDENGKPYKFSGGKMVFNEVLKREIPVGWEVKMLENLLSEFTKGITTSYVEKSNIINLNQKVNKGFKLERQYFKYLNEDIKIPISKFAKQKDILINSLGQGTLGRIHFFRDKVENIVIDQHLFILRAETKLISPSYLFNTLDSASYKLQIERQITGSTGMQMLNASNLKDLNIIVPTIQICDQFERNTNSIYQKITVNEQQNQELAQLRDWLLPMLMNGQVRVGDSEGEVLGLVAEEHSKYEKNISHN